MTRFVSSLLVPLFLCLLSQAADATARPAPQPAAAPPAKAGEDTAEAGSPAVRPLSPPELAARSPVPIWRRGGILVEAGGRALYTFTEDVPGESRCDPRCEALWPPHYAEPDAKPHGPFTIAKSFDGRPMWAWKGEPLYRWVSDRRRGAAGGDGVAGVWFLVKVPRELESEVYAYYPMPAPRPERTTPTTTPSTRTDR